MQDFANFLVSIPEAAIPWIGVAGVVALYIGVKMQSPFLRMVTIGISVLLFVFTFLWMLQWFNVYDDVRGAII